jgi:hypothetical protein
LLSRPGGCAWRERALTADALGSERRTCATDLNPGRFSAPDEVVKGATRASTENPPSGLLLIRIGEDADVGGEIGDGNG